MRKNIEENRSFIMGIAILWIMVFHMPKHEWFGTVGGAIADVGYCGVDIFMLLTGFGICYSLNKDLDLRNYIIKRITKIYISYIPFIIAWVIIRKILVGITIREVFGNITATGWFFQLENQFNWYTGSLMMIYLLLPFIYSLRTKKDIVLLFIVFTLLFLSALGTRYLMLISRFPLLYMGILIARSESSVAHPKVKLLISVIISILIIYLWYKGDMYYRETIEYTGLKWLSTQALAVPVIYIILNLASVLKKTIIYKAITILGKHSFEVFLVHTAEFELLNGIKIYSKPVWTLAFIVGIVLAIIYGYYINMIRSRLFAKEKKVAV